MRISVVTTLYRSKAYLGQYLTEIQAALNQIRCSDYELIFVNDGSPDDSLAYLMERKQEIAQIKLIDLSRNFGHHYAIQVGLANATGDYIFLIDNDLETPPAVLVDFYTEMVKNPSWDVVYGYQETRKGGFVERVAGKMFWILINWLSDIKIPHNILTERLMTKQYVEALLSLKDANVFIGGMMYWVGFAQKGIPIRRGQREGASTYSFKKRAALMFQAVTSFSGKPLEWLFYFGLLISCSSVLFISYVAVKKLILGNAIQLGWTSIVAINSLILGVISMFLGIIGMYIYKIYRQVQGRPNAIVKRKYD